MEDDLNMEEDAPETEGAAALGGLDPQAQLAALFARYPAIEKQRQAERERIKAAKAARFEAARADIEQRRFGAPSPSQQLYALSAALLSPRKQPGIAGTLANVVPALGEMSSLQSKAESQRADAMRQLREQYAIDAEDDVLEALEAESAAVREQMKILGPLAKPRVPRMGGTTVLDGKVVVTMQDDAGVPYTVAVGNAPKDMIPIPGVTAQGQPVFRSADGITTATGEPVTQFDPKETKAEKPRAPSSTEMRQIIQTEDLVNNRLAAIRSVQDALGLNQQAYEGSLAGGRAALARLFSSDDPAYVATEQLEQLVKSGALADLKATFGGNPTEGERKALLELQANITKPRAVREKFLRRLLQEMQIGLGNQTKRLEGLKTGQYSQYQQPAPAQGGGGRTIRYDKNGKRI